MAERLVHLQPTNVGQLSVGAKGELVIAGHPRQVIGQLPEILVGLGVSEEGGLAREQRALVHSHLHFGQLGPGPLALADAESRKGYLVRKSASIRGGPGEAGRVDRRRPVGVAGREGVHVVGSTVPGEL